MMSTTLNVRCACGALEGQVVDPPWVNRAICYCESCQAFPERLGRADEVLDARGGTDIVQTSPASLQFTRGAEHLACLRITPKGPLRWYAACCQSPLGNTLATPKMAFVGLLHSCLGGHAVLDETVGPPRAFVFTETALGDPKPKKVLPRTLLLSFALRLAKARLTGAWKKNPLFTATGEPVARPEAPAPP